jgi:hypothetical protein
MNEVSMIILCLALLLAVALLCLIRGGRLADPVPDDEIEAPPLPARPRCDYTDDDSTACPG